MKEGKYYIELLDIVDLIHAKRSDKWTTILKKVASIFKSDEAFFAANENNNFICNSSSENSYYNYRKVEKETAAYTTIKHKKTLSIKNYMAFIGKSSYWTNKGLKSVLSVPVFYKEDVFGALQVAYFSKYTDFGKHEILLLERIAKIISFVLHNDRNIERYNQIINIETKQIELIYNNQIPKTYKDDNFTRWIKEYLHKILNMTSAKAVGFIFPQEDIYVALSDQKNSNFNLISYTRTERVQNLITYKIWEKQIKNALLLKELKQANIKLSDFSKTFNIQSALFLPTVVNDETVAVFAFGFSISNKVTKDYRIFLQTIVMHIMFAIETSKNLSKVSSILSETEEKFIESFVLMMEARDIYTKGHSQRVAFYTKKIAETLKLNEDEQFMFYAAGIVHDIGKIGIPDAVLLKPGKLTKEEYKIIQYHSEFSYQIIKDINRFKSVADSIRYHHERCDGSGYPKGLKANQIPLGAKILAIADVFDAITTNRPYRNALNLSEAIETIKKMENQFDKEILYQSLRALEESFLFEDMNEPYRNFMPKHMDNIRMEIFTKDFMTGLLNRKTFIEKVEQTIKSGKRFIVFYIDIKDLSHINYRYSMNIGDKVILYTAEILKNTQHIIFLARTQPDVFYFLYFEKIQPELFSIEIKDKLKNVVVQKLSKAEMEINGWANIVDFYVSFSEYTPGRSAEDMMYECQRRKKEMEDFAYDEQ